MARPIGWLAACAALLATTPARSEDKPRYDAAAAVVGASTFRTYCASCHGVTARGDGPLADRLRFAPPDLTLIAARSGGKFPFDKVARIIDGRQPLKGHGGPDMPVWGDAFKNPQAGFDEAAVKRRIDELAHYLASLQEGAAPR
jgi:mono/diheme cytochrome c family protein